MGSQKGTVVVIVSTSICRYISIYLTISQIAWLSSRLRLYVISVAWYHISPRLENLEFTSPVADWRKVSCGKIRRFYGQGWNFKEACTLYLNMIRGNRTEWAMGTHHSTQKCPCAFEELEVVHNICLYKKPWTWRLICFLEILWQTWSRS